ncbi:hypothetical protein [Mycobacterium canetti]|uniref:hypothetical protein n=1 Tax=Mycobacterium canetti TaxID=78331 RepID=UPI0002A589A4
MRKCLSCKEELSAQVTAALADTYRGPWVYAPGEVFADLAVAVADGADRRGGEQLDNRWSLVDRLGRDHVPHLAGVGTAAASSHRPRSA